MVISEMDLFQNLLDSSTLNFESKLDHEVARLLKDSGLTLTVVESITGGMLSQRITTLPGSSTFFLGGIIAYHNQIKVKLAGVSPVTIKTKSVVSEDVALEMVRGLKKLTQSDLCISTTGIAGPETTLYSESMTGKVYIGFIFEEIEKVKFFQFTGTRDMIRRQTTASALMYLKQYLMNKE